jgi:FkbM family methyltransferase
MAASKTARLARSILTPDFATKLAKRALHPALLPADIARLATELRRDAVRYYAAYHQRRGTPGKVFRIRRRHCRMWLPIAWGETVAQRRFGVFEPDTYATLARVVAPGATVIELGACYGEFTIELSRLVGDGGRVYSFEPLPKYFAIAERNVALNTLTNVEIMNQAAGGEDTPELRLDPDATDPYAFLGQISGLSYPGRVAPATAVPETSVRCVSLRGFIAERALAPDLIFMDIEGCEVQVLPDLEPLFRSSGKRPAVYFELHPHFYKPGDQAAIERLFHDCAYTTTRIAGHLLCTPERRATA